MMQGEGGYFQKTKKQKTQKNKSGFWLHVSCLLVP
jgi:hypothetical protein